jgi:hypothetical protein
MFRKTRSLRWASAFIALVLFAGGLQIVSSARADIVGFKNGDPNVWTSAHAVSGDQPVFSGGSLTITTDANNEHNSAFYNNPQIVTGFMATFSLQVTGSLAGEGTAFVIQNDPFGPQVVASQGNGSSLGYAGIQYSIAIAFNINAQQNPIHPGTGYFGETDFFFTDQLGNTNTQDLATGHTYLDTTPVELTTNGPIQVMLTYDSISKNLVETLTDSAGNTFTHTYPGIDIPAIVGGNTAYVGFTGGTGAATAYQTVLNFTFIEL